MSGRSLKPSSPSRSRAQGRRPMRRCCLQRCSPRRYYLRRSNQRRSPAWPTDSSSRNRMQTAGQRRLRETPTCGASIDHRVGLLTRQSAVHLIKPSPIEACASRIEGYRRHRVALASASGIKMYQGLEGEASRKFQRSGCAGVISTTSRMSNCSRRWAPGNSAWRGESQRIVAVPPSCNVAPLW